jgi:hypothetical protein
LPRESIAVTLKLFLPIERVLIRWPQATVPLQVAMGLRDPPSLQ